MTTARSKQGDSLSNQIKDNPAVVLGKSFSTEDFEKLDIYTIDELCDLAYKERRFETFFNCSKAFFDKHSAKPEFGSGLVAMFKSHEDLITASSLHRDPHVMFSSEKLILHMAREALLHIDLGEYELAKKKASRALAYYKQWKKESKAFPYGRTLQIANKQDAAHVGEVYKALGLAAALQGNGEGAREYVGELQRVTREVNEHSGFANAMLQIAQVQVLIALEDYQAASKVLAQDAGANGKDHTKAWGAFFGGGGSPEGVVLGLVFGAVASVSLLNTSSIHKRYMLAKLKLKIGLVDNAEKDYDELLKNKDFLARSSLLYTAYHERGQIALAKGDAKAAVDWFKKSIEIIESSRSSLVDETSKIGFAGNKQVVYHELVQALIEFGRDAEAFEYAERGKARALVDLLASKKTFAGATNDKKITSALEELERLEKASLSQVVKVASSTSLRGIQQAKDVLNVQAPEVASLVSVTSVDVATIQSRLRADEALIEYFYEGQDDKLYAFVVTRGSIKAVVLNANGLNKDVQSFRQTINDYTRNDWRHWSTKLHARLIKPLGRTIAGKRHLTVVPHGALHYLPFNALKAKKGKFLIEKYTVRLLPSASVMKFLNKGDVASKSLLVLGNPDLKNASMDLLGAQKEAKAIARLWKNSKVVLRQHASESVIKKTASAFKYLHLASHGQFNPDAPLKSRMLLAADNENDGNLTVSEIYDLNLNADMVVLSACQTALGDVKNGDDVIGLNRGFLYAGAKSIVGSLWEVPDNPTKELMVSLYKNLKRMDLRKAMQKAQLAALKKHKHPIAWAAFQVTGGN